jgi:hypothetical protein
MDWQRLNKQKPVGNLYTNEQSKVVGYLRLAQ